MKGGIKTEKTEWIGILLGNGASHNYVCVCVQAKKENDRSVYAYIFICIIPIYTNNRL